MKTINAENRKWNGYIRVKIYLKKKTEKYKTDQGKENAFSEKHSW